MSRSIFENLDQKCIQYVAREIAFERVPPHHNSDEPAVRTERIAALTRESRVPATYRISQMSNLQLLELIGKVLSDA